MDPGIMDRDDDAQHQLMFMNNMSWCCASSTDHDACNEWTCFGTWWTTSMQRMRCIDVVHHAPNACTECTTTCSAFGTCIEYNISCMTSCDHDVMQLMNNNPFNSRYITIATVERVILGPVMLVPHVAGSMSPTSIVAGPCWSWCR
jgi:hypothetical protein